MRMRYHAVKFMSLEEMPETLTQDACAEIYV